MSIKSPYLDVRNMSAEEAYKTISECIDKQYLHKDKKSMPSYRCKQILNAITHASLTEEQRSELMARLQQLRERRKDLPSDLKAEYRKAQKEREKQLKQRQIAKASQKSKIKVFGKRSRSSGLTVYAQPAKIIYTPMGGQNKRY